MSITIPNHGAPRHSSLSVSRRHVRCDARDRRSTLLVANINEAAPRRYWPGENPIGQRITVGQPYVPDLADPAPGEIIGIVGDVRKPGARRESCAAYVRPNLQLNETYAALGTRLLPFSVVVRGEGAVANLTSSVQQAIWSVDPQQPITNITLMRRS